MSDSLLKPEFDLERCLKPLPGPNSCGSPVRNTRSYDDIKWRIQEASSASPGQAANIGEAAAAMAADVLANESKDVDIAVWLVAALTWASGPSGLAQGLGFLNRLLSTFWDGLYDTDLDVRSGSVERLCPQLTRPLFATYVEPRRVYTYHDYIASRSKDSPAHADVNSAIEKADRRFYEVMLEKFRSSCEQLDRLRQTCADRFSEHPTGPDLGPLYNRIDEVAGTFESILRGKPVEEVVTPGPGSHQESRHSGDETGGFRSDGAVPSPQAERPRFGVKPGTSPEEAVLAAAELLLEQNPSNPVPFLLVRGLRFGELLAAGSSLSPGMLEPPSRELRTALRRATLDGDWSEALRISEGGARAACGRAWLDLQQRSHQACSQLGYTMAAQAIKAALAACLLLLPDLSRTEMLDGTPTCSAETLEWIDSEVLEPFKAFRTRTLVEANLESQLATSIAAPVPVDPFTQAAEALSDGRFEEAFSLLESARFSERTGRGRMLRRIQLAHIAMEAGRYQLALPLLREVFRRIEQHQLDEWEPADWIGRPLAMLCRCLDKAGGAHEERKQAFERLCRVNPERALELEA